MNGIAFLGLGAMGSRMTARLLAAGHAVTVWNRSVSATRPLRDAGARVADSPAEAAAAAGLVLSMLRDDAAAASVWLDPERGALRGLKSGAAAVDMSTLTVGQTLRLSAAVTAAGGVFVDAPLAGSRPQAEAGQLIFLAGGVAEAVDRIRPVLLAMGSAVHHVGPVGTGMAMKLMVNGLFAAQVAMLAEMLAMGQRLGIDPARAVAVLADLPVTSPAAKGAAAGMVAQAFAPQFPIDLVVKDMDAIGTTARTACAAVPLVESLLQVFTAARDADHGASNITAVARLYRPPAA